MAEERNIRKRLLKGGKDVQGSCQALVNLANASGGKDYITAIVPYRE